MLFLIIVDIILQSASILQRDYSILLSRISISSLLIIFSVNYNSINFLYLEKGLSLYNGLYMCNCNTHIFNIFVVLLSFSILTLTSYYPRLVTGFNFWFTKKINQINVAKKSDKIPQYDNSITTIIDKSSSQFKILEYSLLILFVLCGSIFLMSANDIVSIFISIELQSYGLYLLSSVYRNSEQSTKAGLTYFLLGGLSSCIILLSQGLLYINSGNSNLESIYIISNINNLSTETLYSQLYINTSLIILSVGFLFKVSAAPFHFWSPDVYDGVPTLVTTFIAIIAKISIFIFLLELVHFTNNNATDSLISEVLTYSWTNNLILSSLLSLIIGTVLGLTQTRIKRLYAYSTISHVGFILLALSINTTESIQAFIFYILQYSISNLNAFIILISIGYLFINYSNNNKEYTELKEKNNSPIQLISQIKGLYKLNTVLALSFAVTLFSFLGVPPLLGFFGKQMVLSASLDSGYIFMSLIAILTSVISAVYYLILIKQIFFDDNHYSNTVNIDNIMLKSNTNKDNFYTIDRTYESDNTPNNIKINLVGLSSNITIIISILTLITLMFMFTASESLSLIKLLSLILFSI